MIKEKLKFLLKDSFIYGLSNALSKFFQFITIPLITHFITADEFGIWGILFLYGYIVVGVLTMGMDSAVIRFFYDSDSEEFRSKIFSLGLFSQIFLYVLFITLFHLIEKRIPILIDVDLKFLNEINLVAIWIIFNLITQYCQNWFKWTFQRVKFLVLSLGFTSINFILLWLFLEEGQDNFTLVFYLTVVSQFASAVLGIFWCRKNIVLYLSRKVVRKLFAFGFPMMLVFLFGNATSSLDRIFLIQYLDSTSFGIYSFGQKLSMAMGIFVSAFQIAFGPFIYSQWDKEGSKELFAIIQRYYIIGVSLCILGLSAAGPVLIDFMGSDTYYPSNKILPFLSIGIALSGLYSFASIGIFYAKKPFHNLLCLLIGFLINIIVNIFFTPRFLEFGAITGFILGNLSLVAAAYFFSNKYYSIKFSFWKDLLLLFLLLIICTISIKIVIINDIYWNSALIGVLNVIVFLTSVFFFLSEKERLFIHKILKSKFRG